MLLLLRIVCCGKEIFHMFCEHSLIEPFLQKSFHSAVSNDKNTGHEYRQYTSKRLLWYVLCATWDFSGVVSERKITVRICCGTNQITLWTDVYNSGCPGALKKKRKMGFWHKSLGLEIIKATLCFSGNNRLTFPWNSQSVTRLGSRAENHLVVQLASVNPFFLRSWSWSRQRWS